MNSMHNSSFITTKKMTNLTFIETGLRNKRECFFILISFSALPLKQLKRFAPEKVLIRMIIDNDDN